LTVRAHNVIAAQPRRAVGCCGLLGSRLRTATPAFSQEEREEGEEREEPIETRLALLGAEKPKEAQEPEEAQTALVSHCALLLDPSVNRIFVNLTSAIQLQSVAVENGGNKCRHAQAAELCLLQWLVWPLRITSWPATLRRHRPGPE
jgi:hypothetical protein